MLVVLGLCVRDQCDFLSSSFFSSSFFFLVCVCVDFIYLQTKLLC